MMGEKIELSVGSPTPLAAPHEDDQGSLTLRKAGVTTSEVEFTSCYESELSSLVWFVMSLGADPGAAGAESVGADNVAAWSLEADPAGARGRGMSARLRRLRPAGIPQPM
jgi:hypothetical protein